MGYSVYRLFAALIAKCIVLLVIAWLSVFVAFAAPAFAGGLTVSSPVSTMEKRVDVKKEMVAFVEVISVKPATLYIMYPTQYKKYADTGSTEGVSEYKNLTWLMYPVPALLEDQTVYFVSAGDVRPGDVKINVTYENINERVDRLLKGEEMLRGGTETVIEGGVSMIRLTPLIPGLKVRLDFSGDAQFVIVKTIDFARYRKGQKSFESLFADADIKGRERGYNFSTTDFEDLYLLVKTTTPIRIKSVIHATKESAESGC